jgi:superoxide dismutase, Fe-Mn family
MAHNNHFFFKNLAAEPVEMPGTLEQTLKASFGSIETLRREMVYTASAMFGPGFVWLVKQQQGGSVSFKVLATYLAGSPYAGAHWRRQNVDLNTAVGSTEQGGETARKYLEDTAYGATGRKPADKRHEHAPGGTDVVPVLCLNVWEHVYLPDYGIAGKYAFAEEWWKYINWEAVTETASLSKEIAWGGARGSS